MSMYTSIISGLRALFAQVGAILAPQRSGARRLAGMALVAVLVLVGLVACGPASSGSGSEQQPLPVIMPMLVPVSILYELAAPDTLIVTVTADATAPIAAELTVTVTLTPAMDIPAATVQNMSVMLSADARSSTATFASLAAGSWTLSASGTGVQLSLPTQATIAILPSLALASVHTGTGDGYFMVTIADPLQKVYGISVVDTDSAANSSMITLTVARSDHADDHPRRDQSSRLRRGPVAGITDTASPTSGPFMDGTVWLFLPGDDGDDLPSDLPANYAINGCSTPTDTATCTASPDALNYPAAMDDPSPLARSLSYILMVDAPDDTNWSIQTSEIDFPRLPAGIQTRARTAAEGGPRRGRDDPSGGTPASSLHNGQGYYLLYGPTAGQITSRLDYGVSGPAFFVTIDTETDDLRQDGNIIFQGSPHCTMGSNSLGGEGIVTVTSSTTGNIKTRTFDSSLSTLQIYCVEVYAGGDVKSVIASDNFQFTLNP